MERAVTAGLDYVHVYTRAQVLITQGESWEDRFFTEGVQRKISKSELTQIALPTAARNIMWMSMLDSDALKGDLTTCVAFSSTCEGVTDFLSKSME